MTRTFFALCLLMAGQIAQAQPLYATQGTCAGFARVQVQSPPGTCVALVADASNGLRMPRRILEVAPGRFWIIDAGDSKPNQGRLLEMTLANTPPRVRITTLLDKLDRPLGLLQGPEGRVYVAEAGRIWRTAVSGKPTPDVVADKLPTNGLHPMKEIAFGTLGRLFFSVGSITDDCKDAKGVQASPCEEGSHLMNPRGAVYELRFGLDGRPTELRPYAVGLRHSMALAFVPGPNALLQGESSIDYADEMNPPDELNVLSYGKHYGWPYCVGRGQAARGYEGRHDCSRDEPPAMLWPAHAAPMHMLAVPSDSKGPYANQLIVAWHGERARGHRVVSFTLDGQGVPHGEPRELIGGWSAEPNVRPRGAPAGVALDHLHRLFVVEDVNQTVLMLAPTAP